MGTIVRDGAILGTVIGAIAGYFLLFNAAVDPNVEPQGDDFQDLLGTNTRSSSLPRQSLHHPTWSLQSQGVTLTLIRFKF